MIDQYTHDSQIQEAKDIQIVMEETAFLENTEAILEQITAIAEELYSLKTDLVHEDFIQSLLKDAISEGR